MTIQVCNAAETEVTFCGRPLSILIFVKNIRYSIKNIINFQKVSYSYLCIVGGGGGRTISISSDRKNQIISDRKTCIKTLK